MASVSTMNRSLMAIVRCVAEDSNLTVSLLLGGSVHRLQRQKDEMLEKSLKRIALTLVKIQKRDMRKTDKNTKNRFNHMELAPPTVRLMDSDEKEEIPKETPNVLAWREGACLQVGDTVYKVSCNLPTVLSLGVMSCVMVGSPVIPQVDLEFSDPSLTQWKWWTVSDSSDESIVNTKLQEMSQLDPSLNLPVPPDSQLVHTSGSVYYPTSNDIGKNLLIQCTPVDSDGRCGYSAHICTRCVSTEPSLHPIAKRQLQTPSPLQSSQALRVVSYNILADQYSTTDYASKVLYFYCPPSALQTDYRMGVVVREVVGYHPDIVCMQEVSVKWYEGYLLPAMRNKGFDGHMAVKIGKMPEGEATFFNASKYQSVYSVKFGLYQFLQKDPKCQPLFKELTKAPTVLEKILKRHTIIQLTVLKSLLHENKFIIVGNTHLCYHPTEDNLRLIQVIICIRAFEKVMRDFKESFTTTSDKQPEVGVVFCGDFNSCPCTGGYEFLTKGRLHRTHKDWTQYKYALIPRCGCCEVAPEEAGYILNYSPENEEEGGTMEYQSIVDTLQDHSSDKILPVVTDDFSGLDVAHEFSLQDSCGPLLYTNYTAGFKAVLDYVFSDRTHFSIENVVSLPDHSEVTANTALPSVMFPSDHLALVCDLKWKN